MTRHFLRDDDLSPAEQARLLDLAAELKHKPYDSKPLMGPKTVAMIFDKQTLRTQASFAAGIAELGGYPMLVDGSLAGIGVRESVEDVARVLGRQASVIVWRTYEQARLEAMAEHAGVPVVFLGDGACNVGNSWLLAGATAGMHVRISSPEGYTPSAEMVDAASAIAATTGGSAVLEPDPHAAVAGADVVVTDTWISMGKEEEAAARAEVFGPYAVTEALFDEARPDAIVMHCLPAYRGKEIDAAVLDGPQSVVWDEAENRRHAQKAVLTWLLEET